MITAAWAEQQAIKEVMVFLQGVGVSTSSAVRIHKTYRDEAIEIVRREPYRSCPAEQQPTNQTWRTLSGRST
jgi:exodeoxyribonuclease V alpha subunit